MKRLIIHPKADQDLDREALYLAETMDEDTALRFYEACDVSFNQLQTYPKLGKERPFQNSRIAGIRVRRVKGFSSYLVFYRVLQNAVEILRIIHGARDITTLFEREFLE